MAQRICKVVQEPRLFLSGAQWDGLREKLVDPYFAGIAETNRTALGLLEESRGKSVMEVPQLLGDETTRGEDPMRWRVLRNRLVRTAVAWHLDRDERWRQMARDTVDALISTCAVPQDMGYLQADLKTGDLLYCCSFALDVWGRHLDEAQVSAVYAAMRDVVLPAYMRGVKVKDWWRHADFNWGTALHGNAGLAALFIEKIDPEYAAQVMSTAREGLQYVLEAMPAGGGWTEGFMYQTTMLAHLTDFVYALQRLHGDDLGLSVNRNFVDVLEARPYFIMGDGYLLNFSNCHERTCEYCLPHAFWWAKQLGRSDLSWFEEKHTKPWRDTHGIFYDVEAFWFRETRQESREPQLKPMKHCQGLDWFIWHGKETWLGFRSGYNGGNHNNLDLGQIVFGAGNERILIDPGYGASRSAQHNCVTIRSREQTDGSSAKIFRMREISGGFYLCCDLSACFPHTTAHHYRHVLMIDEKHLLVVDDILGRLGKRTSARYHVQTRLPFERMEDGFVMRGEKRSARVRLLNGFARFDAEQWSWADLLVTTLTWMDVHDKVHAIHPMLISLNEEPVRCAIELDRLTITIGAARYLIDLAEGSLITEL